MSLIESLLIFKGVFGIKLLLKVDMPLNKNVT